MKIIKKFRVGKMINNSYIIEINQKIVLIDAPLEIQKIVRYLQENDLKLDQVWLTHGHYDHIQGLDEIVSLFPNVEIYIDKKEFHYLKDSSKNLSPTGYIYIGKLNDTSNLKKQFPNLQIRKIRGHSLRGNAFIFSEEKKAFVGDTLFRESIGNSTFVDGNEQFLKDDIRNELFTLEKDFKIYPGHGFETTIEFEKKNNPFVKE